METGSGVVDQQVHLKWSGGRLPLGRSCVIGRRSDNDLSLNDAQVSRRHALLTRFGEEWWVNDLDSRNGVSVNCKGKWGLRKKAIGLRNPAPPLQRPRIPLAIRARPLVIR